MMSNVAKLRKSRANWKHKAVDRGNTIRFVGTRFGTNGKNFGVSNASALSTHSRPVRRAP